MTRYYISKGMDFFVCLTNMEKTRLYASKTVFGKSIHKTAEDRK